MIIKQNKNAAREKRRLRVRSKINGTGECPRMNIYRSTEHIYVQLIDDISGKTLVSCSTIAKGVDVKGKNKCQAAEVVGQEAAKRALAKGISNVVFDRAGYLYTGRVKALADGARAGGLKF